MFTYVNQVIAGIFQPYDYESVTVTNSATGLTASKYQDLSPNRIESNSDRGAARAFITVETAQCRYRVDGTDPTSSEGHILNANDVLTLVGQDAITNFKAIRTGGTNSVLKVTYER